MYERFSDRARKVMALAKQEALWRFHKQVNTEHILLALCKEGSGVAAVCLRNLGVNLQSIRLEVEKLVPPGLDSTIDDPSRLTDHPLVQRVLNYAIDEARSLGHNYVGTEHLLLGLSREFEGIAAQVLGALGLSPAGIRAEVKKALHIQPEKTTPADVPETDAFTVWSVVRFAGLQFLLISRGEPTPESMVVEIIGAEICEIATKDNEPIGRLRVVSDRNYRVPMFEKI